MKAILLLQLGPGGKSLLSTTIRFECNNVPDTIMVGDSFWLPIFGKKAVPGAVVVKERFWNERRLFLFCEGKETRHLVIKDLIKQWDAVADEYGTYWLPAQQWK